MLKREKNGCFERDHFVPKVPIKPPSPFWTIRHRDHSVWNGKAPEMWGEQEKNNNSRLIIKADNPLHVPSASVTVTGVSIVFDDVRCQSASHQKRTSKITASLFSRLFVVQLLMLVVAWSLWRPVCFPMQGSGRLTGPVAHFKHRAAGQWNSPRALACCSSTSLYHSPARSLRGQNKWCMFWGNMWEEFAVLCVCETVECLYFSRPVAENIYSFQLEDTCVVYSVKPYQTLRPSLKLIMTVTKQMDWMMVYMKRGF